ncbi:cupin domain-containing protein [Carboxylicivirga taeanensis]|uniref:cupin domain-containing protein n=1 Tax=Carboxylicivirga taeanensis TaxID=1416875 RepID=UPI003F6DC4FE
MKELKTKSEGVNHSAVDIGNLDDIKDYTYIHPKTHQEIKGKVFVGEQLNSSSAEISFTTLPPHAEMPFFHQHKNNEEVYVILKGSGQFQVDDSVFDVSEGTVIRIAPEGKRIYRNNSDSPLSFLCIQNKQGSLEQFCVEDGLLAEGTKMWTE